MKLHNPFTSALILRKSKSLFIICVFLDILFILTASYIIGVYYPKMIDELVTLTKFVGQGLDQPTLGQLYHVQANQHAFQEAYRNVIRYFLVMIFGLYLAYSTLQGIAWKIALKRIKKKAILPGYLRRFFAINAFWVAAFFLLGASYVQLLARIGTSSNALDIIYGALIFFFIYFELITYLQAFKLGFFKNLKTAVREGISISRKTSPVYALMAIIVSLDLLLLGYLNAVPLIILALLTIILLEFLRWEFTSRL